MWYKSSCFFWQCVLFTLWLHYIPHSLETHSEFNIVHISCVIYHYYTKPLCLPRCPLDASFFRHSSANRHEKCEPWSYLLIVCTSRCEPSVTSHSLWVWELWEVYTCVCEQEIETGWEWCWCVCFSGTHLSDEWCFNLSSLPKVLKIRSRSCLEENWTDKQYEPRDVIRFLKGSGRRLQFIRVDWCS